MQIHLSVHDLVDFVLRTGDLDGRIFNRSTMQTGTDMHRQYQHDCRFESLSSTTRNLAHDARSILWLYVCVTLWQDNH